MARAVKTANEHQEQIAVPPPPKIAARLEQIERPQAQRQHREALAASFLPLFIQIIDRLPGKSHWRGADDYLDAAHAAFCMADAFIHVGGLPLKEIREGK